MLSLAFYNAIDIYKHLNLKTGVVSYWERTGGKYNTATMNINMIVTLIQQRGLVVGYAYNIVVSREKKLFSILTKR